MPADGLWLVITGVCNVDDRVALRDGWEVAWQTQRGATRPGISLCRSALEFVKSNHKAGCTTWNTLTPPQDTSPSLCGIEMQTCMSPFSPLAKRKLPSSQSQLPIQRLRRHRSVACLPSGCMHGLPKQRHSPGNFRRPCAPAASAALKASSRATSGSDSMPAAPCSMTRPICF